jgi:hypothetical protein
MKNDRMKHDRIKSDRMKNDRIKSDRIETDRIKSNTDPFACQLSRFVYTVHRIHVLKIVVQYCI